MGNIAAFFLMTVGVIIMAASGICSGYFFIVANKSEPTVLLLPLLFGGLPFSVGFTFYKVGKSMREPPNSGSKPKTETRSKPT